MKHLAALSVLPMLALVGCQPQSGESPPLADDRAAAPTAGPPTLEELKNATYQGLEEPEGPITLVEGRWEGEPYVEGAASRPVVAFVRDFHVLGDLEGDAAPEAVALLSENAGGSGTRTYLAVLTRRGDAVENVATTLLGDRIQVRAVRIESGQLLVDVLRAGADDAACCPGELATLGFTVEGGALSPLDPGVSPARLSLEVLAGTEWVLRSWTWDEAAPAEPEITLQYVEGRFAGQSACNRYFAPVKDKGDVPGALEVGLAAGTMMACPDPAGAMESRLLRQLGGVSSFGFVAGQLSFMYAVDDVVGVMLFEARPPEPPAGS